jgi:hypothetical protein
VRRNVSWRHETLTIAPQPNGQRLMFRHQGEAYVEAPRRSELRESPDTAENTPLLCGADPANEADSLTLAEVIRDQGVFEEWRGRRHKYCYAGDGYRYLGYRA